jgi:hypothetical protein
VELSAQRRADNVGSPRVAVLTLDFTDIQGSGSSEQQAPNVFPARLAAGAQCLTTLHLFSKLFP